MYTILEAVVQQDKRFLCVLLLLSIFVTRTAVASVSDLVDDECEVAAILDGMINEVEQQKEIEAVMAKMIDCLERKEVKLSLRRVVRTVVRREEKRKVRAVLKGMINYIVREAKKPVNTQAPQVGDKNIFAILQGTWEKS